MTFSANPETVAGFNAITRHGGNVPTAYDIPNKVHTNPKSQPTIDRQKASVASAKTKTGTFDILTRSNGKIVRREVKGRIDRENGIGYHKSKSKEWTSTDLATGLSFGRHASTLKGVQAETAKVWDKVHNIKSQRHYASSRNTFEQAARI